MIDKEKSLKVFATLGTAKIAGFTCNKRAPMTIRVDLEVPHEKIGNAIEALGLEGTDELVGTLEKMLSELKNRQL